MGIVRFLLVLAIVLLAVRLVWRLLQPAKTIDEQASNSRKGDGRSDNLLRCSRCGTLTPEDLVLVYKDRPYCSPQCRDDGPAEQD